MARAYGVLSGAYASRHTVYIGVDGRIIDIDRKVKPQTAGADVAQRLEKLKVARKTR